MADLPRWLAVAGLLLWILGQYGLIALALRDLRRRPQVRGGNRVAWGLTVLALPFAGPLLYANAHPGAFPTLPRPRLPRRRPRRSAAPRRALPAGICPPGICSPNQPASGEQGPPGARPGDGRSAWFSSDPNAESAHSGPRNG